MEFERERSITEVFQSIVSNIQHIIRSEFRLLATEMREEGARTLKPAITIGISALFAVYSGMFLLLAIFLRLRIEMASWLAALVVAALAIVVGIALFVVGKSGLKGLHAKPEKTIESVRENVQWAKHQVR
jgi:uncharacterized membrane protein YqjE